MSSVSVKISDIAFDTGHVSSDSVWLEFAGRSVQVETWGTDNASGQETYEDGAPVHGDDMLDAITEALQGRLDAVRERFGVLWNERVLPIIDALTAEILTELGGPFDVDVEGDR